MIDDTTSVCSKTWSKTVENINKVGYSDGIADGQSSRFQTSFDMGYEQGLSLGLQLGFEAAKKQQTHQINNRPEDIRNMNCEICLNGGTLADNVVNLYNTQKEKNDEYLKETLQNK
ncbi:unnamed protein product, partial [Brenthis ino]